MSSDVDTKRTDHSQHDDPDRKIILGSINGVFGIKGWVKVFSETDPRENIVDYRLWWIRQTGLVRGRSDKRSASADAWRQIEVLEGRRQGKTVIARIAGVETPEKAELLIGHDIAVDRSQMPSLDAGVYYWTDLIGYTVLNTDGDKLGTVERLFATGANDVVVVRKDASVRSVGDEPRSGKTDDSELLIPWIMDSVIVKVDTESGLITVDWDLDF